MIIISNFQFFYSSFCSLYFLSPFNFATYTFIIDIISLTNSSYYDLIKNKERIAYWQKKLKEGKNLIVYDFDGPRTVDGQVTCLEVTRELLIEKINHTQFPFGHGYVVAGCIAGLNPTMYI